MKKIVSLLLIVIMLFGAVIAVRAEDSGEIDFGELAGAVGDVNVDTVINSTDLAQLKKILLGTAQVQILKTADVNKDGVINLKDLVRMKKMLADLMTNLYKEYINYRAPLINTYKRLKEDKELKILYFGGSVTAGYGGTWDSNVNDNAGSWRYKSYQWFKNNYPDADITQINTAIGESGTFLGTYRLQDDVIAKNPDLIFIEYAINDRYKGSSKEVAALQYETIVREIKKALPKCDIVTLLVTDKDVAGTMYPTAEGHEEMAEYYNISTVNVGLALWNAIGKTTENWSTYFIDVVHPKDAGYSEYYKCLEEYLNNALLLTDFSRVEDTSSELGVVKSEYLLDGNRTAAMGDNLSEYVITDQTSGFTYIANEYFAGSSGGVHTGYYQTDATHTDAKITFSFKGTEFAFWTNFLQDSTIKYSVDGADYVTISCDSHAPTQVITGLKSAEHTITIMPVSYGSKSDMKIHAIFTRDETLQTVKGGY